MTEDIHKLLFEATYQEHLRALQRLAQALEGMTWEHPAKPILVGLVYDIRMRVYGIK